MWRAGTLRRVVVCGASVEAVGRQCFRGCAGARRFRRGGERGGASASGGRRCFGGCGGLGRFGEWWFAALPWKRWGGGASVDAAERDASVEAVSVGVLPRVVGGGASVDVAGWDASASGGLRRFRGSGGAAVLPWMRRSAT